LGRYIVYSRRVEGEELLNILQKGLLPELFLLFEKVCLRTLDKLDLASLEVSDVNAFIFGEGLGFSFFNDFDLILGNKIDGAID
jgi:hypothetical protein